MRKLIAGMKMSVEREDRGAGRLRGLGGDVGRQLRPHAANRRVPAGRHDVPGLRAVLVRGVERTQQSPPDDRPTADGGRARMGALRRADDTLCLVPHVDLIALAWDEVHPQTRRHRRAEEATRQRHLSGRRRADRRDPCRCRVRGRTPAYRLPADRRPGKALFPAATHRRALDLRKVEQLSNGRLSLIYSVGDVIKEETVAIMSQPQRRDK